MAEGISEKEEQNLLKMELHEEKPLGNDDHRSNSMMRVVGGWTYWRTIYNKLKPEDEGTDTKPVAIAGVFVPERKASSKQE